MTSHEVRIQYQELPGDIDDAEDDAEDDVEEDDDDAVRARYDR